MPVYEFKCPNHGVSEVVLTVGMRDMPIFCVQCGCECTRVFSTFKVVMANPLDIIQRRNRGSVSDDVKARHSGVAPRKRRGPLSK